MLGHALFWIPRTNAILQLESIEAKCHWIPLFFSGFCNQFVLFVTGFHNLSVASEVKFSVCHLIPRTKD